MRKTRQNAARFTLWNGLRDFHSHHSARQEQPKRLTDRVSGPKNIEACVKLPSSIAQAYEGADKCFSGSARAHHAMLEESG